MTTTLVKRPARTPPPTTHTTERAMAEPPSRSEKNSGMAGAGMIMMPVMSGVGSLSIAVTQRNNPVLVIAACLFLVGSIAVGIVMMVSQRTGSKRAEREGRERYLDYIEELRHSIRDQIAGSAPSRPALPGTGPFVDIARDARRRWERRLGHGDFLTLRVGRTRGKPPTISNPQARELRPIVTARACSTAWTRTA
ncbi:MAG: hypothetical protein ACR2FL_03825 [Nocardioidaceae bacterium]